MAEKSPFTDGDIQRITGMFGQLNNILDSFNKQMTEFATKLSAELAELNKEKN